MQYISRILKGQNEYMHTYKNKYMHTCTIPKANTERSKGSGLCSKMLDFWLSPFLEVRCPYASRKVEVIMQCLHTHLICFFLCLCCSS